VSVDLSRAVDDNLRSLFRAMTRLSAGGTRYLLRAA
jgi:hypothetical protein